MALVAIVPVERLRSILERIESLLDSSERRDLYDWDEQPGYVVKEYWEY